mgnify:CR=1 FL=1
MISLFVAHANDRVIGYQNDMPWHVPGDLAYFKRRTMGKPIIMGRKTYESIGRPLPGRLNIVITRNASYEVEGVRVVSSLEDALQVAKEETDAAEYMIIGGEQIFKQAMPLADRMYITKIDETYPGDTFFPAYDLNEWETIEASETALNDEGVPYTFYVYERKRSS